MTDSITTERLLIRLPRASDAVACAAQLDNLDVSKWLGMVPHPYTEADALDFIESYTGAFPKSAFILFEGRLVGGIGIDTELGYWLAPEAWGKGFATEAAIAMINFYFANSDANYILSGYHTGNVRSKNVLAKLGFTPSGMRKSTPKSTGVAVDLHEVTLTRSNWEARR